MTTNSNVRVRFAPSPTGFLHLGSARTALFNWLYAKSQGGALVLRVEDTDKVRSKKEFLDEILEDLKWMNLNWDEGPFFQSERIAAHKQFAHKLLDEGKAYKDGEAIILNVEKGRDIQIDDLIHGTITFNTDQIKDQVLLKSDGSSAYNFACVIDDNDMGITHIIRGDDHISNTPKQILIYEALGFHLPFFAHMPLMMGKDGAKLSKRHGAVAVEEYKKEGFLSDALANYLLLLGWSPGNDQEIISIEEVIERFDIKDVGNVQARFDVDKLKWINGEYIRSQDSSKIFSQLEPKFKELGYVKTDHDKNYAIKIINLYKTRSRLLNDIIAFSECYYKDDFEIDEKGLKKHIVGDENKTVLKAYREKLSYLDKFTEENTEKTCRELAEELCVKTAKVIHPTRVAISGKTVGAGLFDMMTLIGKERVLQRIERMISNN